MAYEPKVWVNDETELSAENFNPMEEGIFGAYPVQLIAIDSTAPSTCVTGDKYYNTSTKKIYTATGTNTWGTNGETPLEDTSYWLISENGNYAWDGTDLVSIGGGKAEVVISDEEPEEGKIWVDTAEIQTIAGRDRLVNVSNEVDEDYRVNILHSKNLFDINNKIENSTISSNGAITNNSGTNIYYIPIEYGKNYIMSFIDNSTGGNVVWGFSNTIPYIGVSSTYNVNTCPQLNNKVFTAPSSSNKYLCIRLATGGGQLASMSNIQIEEGSTATTYEPYITPSINVDGKEMYSKPVVLWQNSNPTNSSGFVGQTITLGDSLDNYKYMEIIYFNTAANSSTYSTGKLKSKTLTTLYYMSGLEAGGNFMCRYRNVSAITSTTITFDTAYVKKLNQTSVDTANDQNIPYQVIGYK